MIPASGSVPNPDPTLRTVEQLLREIANARELIESKVNGNFTTIEARIEGLTSRVTSVVDHHRDIAANVDRHVDIAMADSMKILETRLAAIDKATVLFQQMSSEQLAQLKQLHQEKFDSIAVQFQERDTRTEQTAAGVKIAVDAALQAAKEAVAEQNRSFALATGKSETATMKQIDALGLAIQTANKGLDDKIADMKDRLTRIEGMDLGAARREHTQMSAQTLQHGTNQNVIAICAAVIGFLGVFCAVGGWLYTASRTTAVYQVPAQLPAAPPSTRMRAPISKTEGWCIDDLQNMRRY
jgi:hypothetical protein